VNPQVSVSHFGTNLSSVRERHTTDLGVPNYDTTFGWGLNNSKAALAATP
jgi:hypothetical protein